VRASLGCPHSGRSCSTKPRLGTGGAFRVHKPTRGEFRSSAPKQFGNAGDGSQCLDKKSPAEAGPSVRGSHCGMSVSLGCRLAEVRTIECNRRNRPTPQSLPGFLAQALEEPIFHHIAPSATLPAGGALRYSITSSAVASSDGGISRPRALALLRLITSSYFVGACTGRSAGFSPLRMRST
jgi:hypothetical protein